MCDPVTIGTTLTVASTVAQGYAAQQQGQFERGVSRFNARQLENEATQTRNKGVEEENLQRQRTANFIAGQRAQLAAQGIDIGSGSALALQEDTATIGELDAKRIKTSFLDEASALDTQAEITRDQGDAAAAAGRNAFTGSLLTAGGQVLGSGVADKWFTSKSAAVTASTARSTPLTGLPPGAR